MLVNHLYSYNCNMAGSVFFEWPISLKSKQQFGNNCSYHIHCSLRNLTSDSEEFTRQDGRKRHSERAKPKNPRSQVEISTLEEFTRGLEDKLQTYVESSKPSALFTVEERAALNKNKTNLEKLCPKWPLLHTLAMTGDSFALDQLLRQNVDINTLDKDGYSALQRAVLARKETIVNQLVRAHADIFICDKGGATLLHFSVQTGSMNMVKSFLHCGIDVNSSDKHGWTPLHLAVLIGRADIVRLLLIHGADKTLKTKNGLAAIDLCLSLGRGFNSIEVAKSLKIFPKETNTEAIR